MVVDRKTLLAVVAVATIGWHAWPIDATSPLEMVFVAGTVALVALFALVERARASRGARAVLGGVLLCYGGYELVTGTATVDLALGVSWGVLGGLTVLNQTGLAPWSEYDPVG